MSTQSPTFPDGWRVFPCHPNTKEPIHKGWPALATTDPAQIAAWVEHFPDCNWAVACGPSGLAVLDPDGEIGAESLFAFECAEGFLPDTREHSTPRGGRHLIFSGTIPNSVGKLGPKLDTRGGNGYILIPPSTFNDKPYEVVHDRPVATLPDWVGSAVARARECAKAAGDVSLDSPTAISRVTSLLRGYVSRGHIATEGDGGDERTFAIAAEVLNLGLSEDKAFEVLQPWNDACEPPWGAEELRTKIANAALYAQNDAGAWAVPPVTERIAPEALDKLLADSVTVREDRARFAWMDEDEFTQMPPPEWLLKDIFTRDSIAMLYGPSGHYKSFIAMNLAAAVAQSGECAFYVAAEGIARMARKDYPAWKAAYHEDRKLPFFLVEDMPIADESEDYAAFAESIRERAAGRPVGVIFIDTLNRAMLGLEENSAKDTAKMIQACLFLKKVFHCTVVVVHHTPKNKGDTEPRGSSALYAGFDTVLKVVAEKDVKLVRMWVTKQKTDEEATLPFCYEGQRHAGGLAFVPITPREAMAMSEDADMYSPKAISATLVRIGAFRPKSVSTHVLAQALAPQIQNETDEARATGLARVKKALTAAAKKKGLSGYFEDVSGRKEWSLPTEDNASAASMSNSSATISA